VTAITATKLACSRSNVLDKMERLLSIWIEEQNQRHILMSKLIIIEKARSVSSYLQEQSKELKTETFGASHGWLIGLNVAVTCTA
jgi:hypothetical protein